jgi:Tol biopolymer transport system component
VPSKSDTRYFNISPDEAEIVYVDQTDGQSDLWISAIKDGLPVRLTNDKDEEIQPRWHADGKRILYTVHRNNYFQINIAYTDRRTPRQVTRGESDYRLIDLSGDGTKIYYHSREKKSNIWGVKTDTGEEFETVPGEDSEFWADVSPDGSKIVYQSYLIEQTIHLAPNSSKIVQSPNDQLSPFSVKGWNPRWLPDNRRIAFLRRDEKEQKSNLWLVDIISGEEKQITNTSVTPPSYSFLPINRSQTREYSFSPDSRQVVYLAKESGFGNILKTSTESGETVNVTNNTNPNLFFYSPHFSPDGKRVAFVSQQKPDSKDEKVVWKIWIVEQGQPKVIYLTGASLRLLDWTSDGALVLGKSDVPMSAIPLDITLLRISSAGEKRFETVLKNIYVTSMSLSADGKEVVFTARLEDKDNLFIASTNVSEIKKVTANGNSRLFYGSPAFSPDSKAIFFGKQEETNAISRLENFK